MSLAASAKPLARERSSSENFLKALQQAESGTKEAAPISGDYSFVEPKTTSKSLQMRILDPVHHPGWDADCRFASRCRLFPHQCLGKGASPNL